MKKKEQKVKWKKLLPLEKNKNYLSKILEESRKFQEINKWLREMAENIIKKDERIKERKSKE